MLSLFRFHLPPFPQKRLILRLALFRLCFVTLPSDVHCAVKTVFYFTLGYVLRTPDNSNLFSISLEGLSYRESTVY